MDCNFDQCKFPKEEEEVLPPAELLEDYHKKRAALDKKIDKKLEQIQKLLGIDTIVIPDSVRGSRS
jgi:type I restriction enzyme M protein